MTEWIKTSSEWWAQCGWMLQVIVTLVLTALARFTQALICRRLVPKIKRSRKGWEHALFDATGKPLSILIWLLGLSFALETFLHQFDATLLNTFMHPARRVVIIAGFVWIMLRFVRNVEEYAIRRGQNEEGFDKTRVHAISRVINVIVITVSVLIILQSLNFQISSVLALGGIGGLAISFAAKDVLANFFGGLMIYFDRPFSVGDWIRSPDKNIEGTVEYIGWRSTRVRTFDKRPLYIPNGIFSNISIENPSRMTNRRIKFILGVRYDDAAKVKQITDNIESMLRAHEEVDTDMALWVNMTGFGPSSLDITVYAFTKTHLWIPFQTIQQDVLLQIHDIVQAAGAECAFPTRTLHIPEQVAFHQN